MKSRRNPFFASLLFGALLFLGVTTTGSHTTKLELPASGDFDVAFFPGITIAHVARMRSEIFATATDTIRIQRRDRSFAGRFKEHYSSLALSLWQQTGERSQFLFDSALQFCPSPEDIICRSPVTSRTALCSDDVIVIPTSTGFTNLFLHP